MTNYRDLSKAGAADALQEFLDERGPALSRLRERLVADGQDPAVLLVEHRRAPGFALRI
ncbi:hypothetical protein [Arthrobacter sp. U41]|uniref:hypothetical protein n=1 Tax=Arthrobacter sp. U41 TaxID=1849032 RepID=UPI0012F82D9A|nr:hypothetical protein [Arthrobacter sp. U41]